MVIGSRILKMAKGKKLMQMDRISRASTKKERKKGKESSTMPKMASHTMVNGPKTKRTEMVFKLGQMDAITLASGNATKCMVKEFLPRPIKTNTRAGLNLERSRTLTGPILGLIKSNTSAPLLTIKCKILAC